MQLSQYFRYLFRPNLYATKERMSIFHVKDAKKYMECECDWRAGYAGRVNTPPVIIKV